MTGGRQLPLTAPLSALQASPPGAVTTLKCHLTLVRETRCYDTRYNHFRAFIPIFLHHINLNEIQAKKRFPLSLRHNFSTGSYLPQRPQLPKPKLHPYIPIPPALKMTVRPQITQAPKPSAVFTPPTSSVEGGAGAQPSAVPIPDRTVKTPDTADSNAKPGKGGSFAQPKLRLEIRDLDHPGATKFLSAVNVGTIFSVAVKNVQRLLYRAPSEPHTNVPPTRSVTLILRDMGGVAYTTGTELDPDHKEIHFSLSYIDGIDTSRLTAEITGVLTHELVHCYQWDACGSCPGGLIEGIADWVRLSCDLSPPHWKREVEGGA